MSAVAERVRRAVDAAHAHWSAGDADAALAAVRKALRLDPTNVDALAQAGTLLWLRDETDEAERLYRRAHALDPRHAGVLLNLATLAHEADDLDASLAWIDRATVVRPGRPDIAWRRGLVELALGDYAHGWTHYEAGLFDPALRGVGPGFPSPPWDGSPCDRLLLWHEQGLGDTIQFVRYAGKCRDRVRRVVVLCPTELVALMKRCPWVDDAVDAIDADAFDAHVPMMSLPHRFGTTLASIPADVPYLSADPAQVATLAPLDAERLHVGLVWSGGVRSDETRFRVIDRHRSMPLASLSPLFAIDGVDFHGLQLGARRADAAGTPVLDAMADVRDFADTAAIVDRLDLVISVDTAVAHLAGAMAKPVWVLSRRDACWRWLRNRPDSPWYPTARVFGQSTRGRWDDVVARVADGLRSVVAARR